MGGQIEIGGEDPVGAAVQRNRTESGRDLDAIARKRQLHLSGAFQSQSVAGAFGDDNSSGTINGNSHTIDCTSLILTASMRFSRTASTRIV